MLSRCPERLPLAASISFPTSRSVRCSRGLNSAFGRRRGGATVRFTVPGDTTQNAATAIRSWPNSRHVAMVDAVSVPLCRAGKS